MLGEHPMRLDDKGRVIVPAEVRHRFDPDKDGEGFVIVIGQNDRPWLYPAGRYEALVSELESQLSPDQDRLDFAHMYFSAATEQRWDKQGRMPVPAGDHYEYWPNDLWAQRKRELAAKRSELATKQRQAQERAKAARSARPTEGIEGRFQ
jgi:DNA-binding transcriptional regulator/RsmH inhibitor MraZ